eukprot:4188461-Amphidinium_carterae.1
MVKELEGLHVESWVVTPGAKRVETIQSDRDRAFRSIHFRQMLDELGLVHHTTQGYTPQQNGLAENTVKKFKVLLRRNIRGTGIPFGAWGYMLKYIIVCLWKHTLKMGHKGPFLGQQVIASPLGPKKADSLLQKGVQGRLLFYNEFGDKSSYLLVGEDIVHCDVPVAHPDVSPGVEPSDMTVESEGIDISKVEGVWTDMTLPQYVGKNTIVDNKVVLGSTGVTWEKWKKAIQKELDSLYNTGALKKVTADEAKYERNQAQKRDIPIQVIPGSLICSLKSKVKEDMVFKARIVGCGNFAREVMGQLATSDLDSNLLRWLISYGALRMKGKCRDLIMASVDFSTAFLNAPIPDNRLVLMHPPKMLESLDLIEK